MWVSGMQENREAAKTLELASACAGMINKMKMMIWMRNNNEEMIVENQSS